MEFETGNVVISKAGRDKGYFMAVVEANADTVTVADGKERPLSRPKRKNPKHLQKTNFKVDFEQLTDKKLRTYLRVLSGQNGKKELSAVSDTDIIEENDQA